jgi:hypothetical protein
MKRIALFTTVLFTIALTSWGKPRMLLSFTGSPSFNWMSTNNRIAEREKLIMGYDFGLNGDIYFSESERYSLLTGLQIINTGGEVSYRTGEPFQFSGATLPPLTKIKYMLRYVEIPMAIKLKTDQFRRVRYWGQFGMSGMLNIGAKGTSNDGTFVKTNINDEINMFNLSMDVGAGFDFDLGGNNSVTAGLIFQNGLVDVTTDNAFSDKTIVNSLKVRIGVIF